MTGVFLHGSPTAADNAGMMQKTREDRKQTENSTKDLIRLCTQ
ncbi:hypothetical protein CL3_04310 [butyrate-producing bacterium SM4/1]|nr:hypothetical protein CL3_04310 [butyrate-producing bacterium SM4/1]